MRNFPPYPRKTLYDEHADIRVKSKLVIKHILSIIDSGKSLSVVCSARKDVCALLVLSIVAYKRAIDFKHKVHGFHVIKSTSGQETGSVEDIEIMLSSIRSHSKEHGLGIQIHEKFAEIENIKAHTSLVPTRSSKSIDLQIRTMKGSKPLTSINAEPEIFSVSALLADWDKDDHRNLLYALNWFSYRPVFHTFVMDAVWVSFLPEFND